MGKVRKKTSKRTKLHTKYVIKKKVNEHKKKLRKETKKLKAQGMKPKYKKDLGVPNLFPYKEELLNQLERKERLDEEQKAHLKSLQDANRTLPKGTMAHFVQEISAKVEKYEEEEK